MDPNYPLQGPLDSIFPLRPRCPLCLSRKLAQIALPRYLGHAHWQVRQRLRPSPQLAVIRPASIAQLRAFPILRGLGSYLSLTLGTSAKGKLTTVSSWPSPCNNAARARSQFTQCILRPVAPHGEFWADHFRVIASLALLARSSSWGAKEAGERAYARIAATAPLTPSMLISRFRL
jgi:hypothetical protein